MQQYGNEDMKLFSGCSDFTFSKGSIIADFKINFETRSKPKEQIKRDDILDAFNKTIKDPSSSLSGLNAEKVTISKIQSDGFPTQIFTTESPIITTAENEDSTTIKIEQTTKQNKLTTNTKDNKFTTSVTTEAETSTESTSQSSSVQISTSSTAIPNENSKLIVYF